MGRDDTPQNLPENLPQRWRERAELLRDWGGTPEAARLWERAATELEQALAAAGSEILTLKEAALLTGLTAGHLGDLVRDGTIPNAGRKGSPRIRRADLPVTTKREPDQPRRAVLSRREITSIVGRRRNP